MQHCTQSGLCNRLRGWTGIGAIADYYGLSFLVHWNRHAACSSTFADVFVPDTCAIMPSRRDGRKYKRIREFVGERSTHIVEWYNRTQLEIPHDEFMTIATARARALRLQPEFEDTLEAFMETVPADAIGLHVRRTDLPNCRQSDPLLKKELDRVVAEDADAQFLLCSDNFDSVKWLRRLYGDRIIWREQTMRPQRARRGRHTSVADSAIDLFSLARTKELIGTYWSSFSTHAALMGGIPLRTF